MKRQFQPPTPTRRQLLAGAALGSAGLLQTLTIHPTRAAPASVEDAIRDFVGEAQVRPGKVRLDIPALVENGNAVPITVAVDHPMMAGDFVQSLALFNDKNPQPNVAVFHLGPRAGKAMVSTRIRLATSQTITAIAQLSDGSFWSSTAEVVVTLAACTEG